MDERQFPVEGLVGRPEGPPILVARISDPNPHALLHAAPQEHLTECVACVAEHVLWFYRDLDVPIFKAEVPLPEYA